MDEEETEDDDVDVDDRSIDKYEVAEYETHYADEADVVEVEDEDGS